MSDSTTPVAVLGPLLVTLIEKVRFPPTVTDIGAVTATARSALGVTVVVALAELFVMSGSVGWLVTLTISAIVGTDPALVNTTIVTTSVAPAASEPRVMVGCLSVGAVPCVAVDETTCPIAGNISVSITFVAVAGPLLVTSMVYVSCCPAGTELADADMVTPTSAEELTVTDVVAVTALFARFGGVLLETLAVSGTVVVTSTWGVTTSVAVAVAPLASVLSGMVTRPPAAAPRPPVDDEAETNVRVGGSWSVIDAPTALLGPLFTTVIV